MKKFLFTLFSFVMSMCIAMAAGGYTCEGASKVTSGDLPVKDYVVSQAVSVEQGYHFDFRIDVGTLPLMYGIEGGKLPDYVPAVIGEPGNLFALVNHPVHGKHLTCSCSRC